jgi:hypothetical protein
MELEVGPEIPPLVRVELAIDTTAIVLDTLDLGETFVSHRTIGKVLQTAGITVVVHLGVGSEKGLPCLLVPLLKGVYRRLDRCVSKLVGSRALGFSWTPNCDENESEITRRCV